MRREPPEAFEEDKPPLTIREILSLPDWVTGRRAALAAGATLIFGLLMLGLRAAPVQVDLGSVSRGPLAVTADEEGRTRVRNVFVVSAPISGRVLRTALDVGDKVERDKTIVAMLEPVAPAFLDARSHRELEALVAAAEAGVTLAKAEQVQANSELVFAQAELQRAQTLANTASGSVRNLDKAKLDVATRMANVERAKANLEMRLREHESAVARLMGPDRVANSELDSKVEVRSPVDGRVLRRIHESEKVVTAGAPLTEIGDPRDIEVFVELLSSDAVKVREGASAILESWGGKGPLAAVVKRVEPAGFTKISALGIEEQRVRVILDITSPPEQWATLGHDYRVYARITIWSTDDTLRIPISALFRQGEDWATFTIEHGVAHAVKLDLGQRNTEFAQVISGVSDGQKVLLHPSDRVVEGGRIAERAER